MEGRKTRHIIASVCGDNGIGYKNNLIAKIPDDMARFKELTLGNVVIMGRKTYESIGKPLNCRDNIVVTSKDLNIEGVHCVRSLEDAYRLAEELDGEKVFVIGGGKLYEDAINTVDTLEITRVNFFPSYVDTYFPEIDINKWYISKRSNIYGGTGKVYPYMYVTYKRK